VLLLVAIKRVVQAVVLISVGLLLLTRSHSNWQQSLRELANSAGLHSSRQGLVQVVIAAAV